jgi:hypothetical protein
MTGRSDGNDCVPGQLPENPNSPPSGTGWKKVAALLLSTGLSLGLAEAAVRLTCHRSDLLRVATVADPVLGHRIPPYAGGHDANGFRNHSVPTHAPIVAVGDSQTYGISAAAGESWPAQLGSRSGLTVYNMGLGGYCPLDYDVVVRKMTPALSPRLVVVGLYFGNDFLECFNAVAGGGRYQAYRDPSLPPPPPATDSKPAVDTQSFSGIRGWLSINSMLYGLVKSRSANLLFFLEAKSRAARTIPDELLPWVDPTRPAIRTAFTARTRLDAIDLDLPPVRAGLRLVEGALERIQQNLAARGTGLLVVLIPTKELVYEPNVSRHGDEIPAALRSLWLAEHSLREEVQVFLTERKIDWVDALPALQEALARGRQLYPQNHDGHPNGGGYGVIADVVNGTTAVRSLVDATDAGRRMAE